MQKISQISGVTFDWDSDHRKGHDVGVIAQEIEKILPVNEDPDLANKIKVKKNNVKE